MVAAKLATLPKGRHASIEALSQGAAADMLNVSQAVDSTPSPLIRGASAANSAKRTTPPQTCPSG
jgi:hypothetical protein